MSKWRLVFLISFDCNQIFFGFLSTGCLPNLDSKQSAEYLTYSHQTMKDQQQQIRARFAQQQNLMFRP